jgi:hypothetical protein
MPVDCKALNEAAGKVTGLDRCVKVWLEQELPDTTAMKRSMSLPTPGLTRKVTWTLGARQPSAGTRLRLEPSEAALSCEANA